MKKQSLLFIAVFLLSLTACTNDEPQAKDDRHLKAENEVKSEQIQANNSDKTKEVTQNSVTSSEQIAPALDLETDIKDADLSILIMGDSLSAGYGIVLEQSWVQLLQNDLEKDEQNVAITNGSISGETTGGGLARLDDLLKRSQPDIVIIELGGNDGLRGYPVKSIRKNLESMIAKSRAVGAKVLLCGIMIPPNYGERYANAFAELYPALSKDLDLPLVPFILDGVALNDDMMQNDGIHPNENGQPRIRDNVMKVLKEIL